MTRRGLLDVVLTGLLLGLFWLGPAGGEVVAQSRRFGSSRDHEKNHRDVRAAFAESVEAASKATVQILAGDKQVGLGTVVDAQGLIVTKASLLHGETRCKVRAGRLLDATVVGVENTYDLALLRVRVGELTAVDWREGDPPRVGSWVATVDTSDVPLAVGVISTPPQIVPGPARAEGERGFLGVSLSTVALGPRVDQVTRESAAERAGIRAGDIILKLDGSPIRSVEEVIRTIGGRAPGTKLRVGLKRGEEPLDLEATLGKVPESVRRVRSSQDKWGGGPFSRRRTGFPDVLTHDTAMPPNRCGGPLVDLEGRVAGINIARAARVTTYAAPVAAVRKVVDDLLSAGGARFVRRIDPEGIRGSIVLFGGESLPEKLASRFVDLAGGEQARLVVIGDREEGGSEGSTGSVPSEFWRGQTPAAVSRFSADDVGGEACREAIAMATGVWMDSALPEEEGAKPGTDLADALRALLARGGALGAGPAGASLVATLSVAAGASGGSEAPAQSGGELVPDLALEIGVPQGASPDVLAAVVESNPSLVGLAVEADAAVLLQGRNLSVLNGGGALIQLASGEGREARREPLTGGQRVDWIALRRAARDRGSPAFPAAQPESPEVPHGALVLVGGGRVPQEAIRRFIELAGGEDAPVVVLPTALPEPSGTGSRDAEMLRRAGARDVRVLTARRIADVSGPEFREALERARGVWFGGGRQWRFVDAYESTPAHELLRDVLRRGGVLGGSSAGASIQAEYLARGDPLGNLDIMAEGYERGLGFLPGVAVDQHFSQRQRFDDLSSLVERYPQLLGIGIDEGTAIIVRGSVAEVVGSGGVYFYDRRGSRTGEREEPPEPLRAGQHYHLEDRRSEGRVYRSVWV